MSQIMNERVKCAVCGQFSTQINLISTNQLGSPDLDLRPAPMARDTMAWWLQACPHCFYVAEDLRQESPVSLSWLAREQYRTADGISFPTELARNFYRRHLIAAEMGHTGEAYAAVLHAAWVCDDEGDCENAVRCRKLALTFLDDAIEKSGPNEDMIMIRADLLRRSGQFDKLIREYSDRTFSKAILNDIVAFQLKRAAEKDTQCYTIAQACDKPDETT